MRRKTKLLLQENNRAEEALSAKGRELLTDIVVYLRGSRVSTWEQELVRRDITEMLLDAEARADACDALNAAAPAVTSWRDGAVTLQTDSAADGLAVLTLPYDRNWTAALDGQPVEVQAAGYLLGVAVPAGTHTLTLTYTQPGTGAGLALSALGLGLVLLLAFRRRRPAKA